MKNSAAAAMILILIMGVSCARVPVDKVPEMYWPMPPDKPRIKFVDSIVGSIDATGQETNRFKLLLFGSPEEYYLNKPTFALKHGDVLYISDVFGVHKMDFKNKKYSFMGAGVVRSASGLGVLPDGTILVGDSSSLDIYMFKPGIESPDVIKAIGLLYSVGGIEVDYARKRFYVADVKAHNIKIFSYEGKVLDVKGKRGSRDGFFNYPYDIAIDGNGDIYVLDSGNFRVQVFDGDFNFKRSFGSVGSQPGMFARPKGIDIDSDDNVYITDAAFGNFQILSPEGRPNLAVGTSGSDPGTFNMPFGIYIDDEDKIYVVDQINRRVQVFQYLRADGTAGSPE